MKDYDYKGIVETITAAAPSHLALVSFLVLPVVTNYWLEAIIKAFPDITLAGKSLAILFLALVYIFCLGWLVRDNKRAKRRKSIRDQIVAKMTANQWTRTRFDKAQKAITFHVNDEELISIIAEFPETLRYLLVPDKDAEGNPIVSNGKKEARPCGWFGNRTEEKLTSSNFFVSKAPTHSGFVVDDQESSLANSATIAVPAALPTAFSSTARILCIASFMITSLGFGDAACALTVAKSASISAR